MNASVWQAFARRCPPRISWRLVRRTWLDDGIADRERIYLPDIRTGFNERSDDMPCSPRRACFAAGRLRPLLGE